MMPNMMRNAAETEDPMMPPTREKASNLLDTAAAVPATTNDVTITILSRPLVPRHPIREEYIITYVECPNEKNIPTVTGL